MDLGELLRALQAPDVDPEDVVIDLAAVPPGELEGLAAASVDVVLAAGAFRRIASARAQLDSIIDIARVLRPGGWAAFALSTDPAPEGEPRHSRRGMLRALAGAPSEPPRPAAGFVPLDALGATAVQAGLRLERIEGANTRDTLVLAVKEAN